MGLNKRRVEDYNLPPFNNYRQHLIVINKRIDTLEQLVNKLLEEKKGG